MDSDSLADGKISSVFIYAVLRIVCLKVSIFGVKRASDEKLCPRTVPPDTLGSKDQERLLEESEYILQ